MYVYIFIYLVIRVYSCIDLPMFVCVTNISVYFDVFADLLEFLCINIFKRILFYYLFLYYIIYLFICLFGR